MIATRIGSTRIVACGSPGYFAARGRPAAPEDLRDHHCITFDNLASPKYTREVAMLPATVNRCVAGSYVSAEASTGVALAPIPPTASTEPSASVIKGVPI